MPYPHHPPRACYNRIIPLMAHTVRYAFHGLPLLARDIKIARTTMYRIARDEVKPSFWEAERITQALSQALQKPIPLQEIFTTTGRYPTISGCELCDCRGCRPDWAYTPSGKLRLEHLQERPGDWTLYPA
jgi:DNA-binding XRE family transcriptional regulator